MNPLSSESVISLAGVKPDFVIESEHVSIPEPAVKPIDSCGLSLSRNEDLWRMYDVAGHKALLIGNEGGQFEVWAYPLQLFISCEIGFLVDGSIIWSNAAKRTFTSTPDAAYTTYEAPGLSVTQTIFAPMNEPGIVMLFESKSEKPVTLVARLEDNLVLMWPAEELGEETERGFDTGTGAWMIRSKERKHAAVAGWAGGAAKIELPEDPKLLDAIVTAKELQPGKIACLAFSGGVDGLDAARGVWVNLASDPYVYWQESAKYYKDLDTQTLSMTTPDDMINEAYRWAKVGLDKSYKISSGTGAGFVAGYNFSSNNARPGFGWYFGRDSSWCQYAANTYGQFDKSRENTELMARWQIFDGPDQGKIYHEIGASHGHLTEESWRRGYAFPAADATPFFVINIADYLNWTGDVEFVKANWQHLLDAMDWCYRLDVDGDLLIDNPPAGHQWYDGGEKNMIDLVAIWCKALECAAELADLLGDEHAGKWREDAARVRNILNTDFWDESRGYLYDRKLPDGTMIDITTANPTIPLLWNQIEPEKAEKAINRMLQPDMTVPWGVRTNSNMDSIYRHNGYHAGTVWPLVTGWASIAAFNNHHTDAGLAYLKGNTDLHRKFTLGYIVEVLDGETQDPIGCPHQAWSEGMVISPLVEGLLGIRVDALNKTLTFAPHIPADWPGVKADNLKIANNCFNIDFKRTESAVKITIEQTAGPDAYTAIIAPAFDKAVEKVDATVNGEPVEAQIQQTLGDVHAHVSAVIAPKIVVEFVV